MEGSGHDDMLAYMVRARGQPSPLEVGTLELEPTMRKAIVSTAAYKANDATLKAHREETLLALETASHALCPQQTA